MLVEPITVEVGSTGAKVIVPGFDIVDDGDDDDGGDSGIETVTVVDGGGDSGTVETMTVVDCAGGKDVALLPGSIDVDELKLELKERIGEADDNDGRIADVVINVSEGVELKGV